MTGCGYCNHRGIVTLVEIAGVPDYRATRKGDDPADLIPCPDCQVRPFVAFLRYWCGTPVFPPMRSARWVGNSIVTEHDEVPGKVQVVRRAAS